MKNLIIAICLVIGAFIACIGVYNINNPDNKLPSPKALLVSINSTRGEEIIGVCSQGEPEDFIYSGTYRPLIGGRYTAKFDISGQGKIFFDVVSSQGTRFHSSEEITLKNKSSEMLNLEFQTNYLQSDVELRIRRLDNSKVCVNSLVLERESINWRTNFRAILLFFKKLTTD